MILNNSEYSGVLTNVRQEMRLLDDSGRIVGTAVVLDIDNTIGVCLPEYDIYKEIKNNPEHFPVKNYLFKILMDGKWNSVVSRPHLVEFLDFCFSTFEFVCVYSAGAKIYVDEIVKTLFPKKPHVVLCWDDVVKSNNGKLYHKSLEVVLDRIKSSYDRILGINDLIIIDDRLGNVKTQPNNAIIIKPFEPKDLETVILDLNTDKHLLDVITHLKSLIIIRLMRILGPARGFDIGKIYDEVMKFTEDFQNHPELFVE